MRYGELEEESIQDRFAIFVNGEFIIGTSTEEEGKRVDWKRIGKIGF